jgi:hypothetical protein
VLAQLLKQGSADQRRLAHYAAGCGDREAVARHAPLAAVHREAHGLVADEIYQVTEGA